MNDHTMNELYHHRAVLFAILVNSNRDNAWKSMRHDDGSMFDNMFIVGLNTEFGVVTYHYYMTEWAMFKCEEVEYAPAWDGVVGGSIHRLEQLANL